MVKNVGKLWSKSLRVPGSYLSVESKLLLMQRHRNFKVYQREVAQKKKSYKSCFGSYKVMVRNLEK